MSMPTVTMQPWRTKPPERLSINEIKSPVERPGFLFALMRVPRRTRRFPIPQGIAVIGRNKRTTLVTSVQKLLDRMKSRKFSMRRLPYVR
jgi:hypothetical protein